MPNEQKSRRRREDSICPLGIETCPGPTRELQEPSSKEPLFTKFSVSLLGLLVMLVIAMVSFWQVSLHTRLTVLEQKVAEIGKNQAVVLTDLQAIRAGIDDLEVDMRDHLKNTNRER